MSAEVAGKLRAIAAEIEEHPERWAQNALGYTAGGEQLWDEEEDLERLRTEAVRLCALGFCRRDDLDVRLVAEALEVPLFTYVATWNDEPGRKAGDIADLFRKAADIAETKP